MATADVFAYPDDGEDDAWRYYSGSLLDEKGEPPPSLSPLDPLLGAFGRDDDDESSKRVVTLKAWLGTRGATTALHYDSQHNAYAQLHGEKIFELYPSEALETSRIQLYPRIHPLSHFSRRGAAMHFGDDAKVDETGASSEAAARPIQRIRLFAGDVLYIPPFWGHAATCEQSCIAANVWVSSQAMHQNDAVERLPLPFESHWSAGLKARAAVHFLLRLLQEASGGVKRCAPVETLLETRWRDADVELFGDRRYERPTDVSEARRSECRPMTADHDEITPTAIAKLTSYAETRAHALKAIEARVRATLLADQLERVAHWATGGVAVATYALPQRLAECCQAGNEATKDEL